MAHNWFMNSVGYIVKRRKHSASLSTQMQAKETAKSYLVRKPAYKNISTLW